MKDGLTAFIAIAFVFLCLAGASFCITALAVKLICWCFSLTFTWNIAIGVWLIMSPLTFWINARKVR